MTAVRVGGVWLDRVAPTADLRDETVYRTAGWSGDYKAEVTWLLDADRAASLVARYDTFEVREHGRRTWGGYVAELEIGEGKVTIHAYGFGARGDEYPALYDPAGADPLQPWDIPQDVVSQAIADRGLPWTILDSLGTAAVGGTDDVVSIGVLLDRAAARLGQRWWVDSWGGVDYVSDPTTVAWSLAPGSAYLGTADDQYLTHLYGRYVSSVDGVTGEPDGWSIVEAGDDEMAEQFGRKFATVDLTPLGLLSAVDAQADIDGRFALVGARMGWTNGIDLSSLNLRKPGWGKASPLSVRAGEKLRIPGARDTRSSPTTRAAIEVVLGHVTRLHDEGRAFAEPVGFTPRDMQGALQVSRPEQVIAA